MWHSTSSVIAVVGGDRRQVAAALALRQAGFAVRMAALPGLPVTDPVHALDGADAWLLPPTPVGPDGLVAGGAGPGGFRVTLDALLRLNPAGLLLSGPLAPGVGELVAAAGIRHVNYAAADDFSAANAVLTAEGTLAYLVAVRGMALADTAIAVIGYGRCGQAVARRAADWGARTTVLARSEAARWSARAEGLAARGLDGLAEAVAEARVIINTVPAPVLDATALRRVGEGAYVLDLASPPGGVDWEAARRFAVDGEVLAGVPGRLLPGPAGRAVAACVARLLRAKALAPRASDRPGHGAC